MWFFNIPSIYIYVVTLQFTVQYTFNIYVCGYLAVYSSIYLQYIYMWLPCSLQFNIPSIYIYVVTLQFTVQYTFNIYVCGYLAVYSSIYLQYIYMWLPCIYILKVYWTVNCKVTTYIYILKVYWTVNCKVTTYIYIEGILNCKLQGNHIYIYWRYIEL